MKPQLLTITLTFMTLWAVGQSKIPPPDTIAVWFKEVYTSKTNWVNGKSYDTDTVVINEFWQHGYIIWQSVFENKNRYPVAEPAVYIIHDPTYTVPLKDSSIPYKFLYADKQPVKNKVIQFITDSTAIVKPKKK